MLKMIEAGLLLNVGANADVIFKEALAVGVSKSPLTP